MHRFRSTAFPSLIYTFLFTIFLLAATGCGSSPQSYVDRGNRFFKEGKLDDASLQYQKALQKAPNLGEAHLRMGLLELRKNSAVQAYRELQRAVDLMPENPEALANFGELSLTIYSADQQHPAQLFDQATSAAAKLLKGNAANFDGNVLSGALAMIEKKPGPAVEYLRKAVQAKPSDLNAKLGLARALSQNSEPAAAVALAREIIRTDKTFGGAYDFLFQQYRATGKNDEAENALKLKVANNPKQAAFLLELARYYAADNRPAEMTATLQRLVDNPGAFPDGRLLVGDFYYNTGKMEDAFRQYDAGLHGSAKDKIPYRKRIVRILAVQRKWAEAREQLDVVLKEQPGDDEAKMVRALVWLDEGQPDKLEPAIAELRSQLPKHPQDAVLRYQVGNALVRKGDWEGARTEWVASSKLNANYLLPRYALAQLYLNQNRAEDAVQVSEEIMTVTPRDPKAQLLHAACLTGAGQFQRARTELNRLESQYPKAPEVRFRLGVLAISEGKFKEAEDIFRQLEGSGAKAPQVLAGLAQALEGQSQSPKAMQMLQDELVKTPNSPTLRQMLAKLAMVGGKYDVAIEQYKQLCAMAPAAPEPQLSLAAAYSAKGDVASAIPVLKKVVGTNPKNALASIQLAQAYFSIGQLEDAKVLYRTTLKTQPHDANALNDLAFVMAESGDNLDEALSLAQQGMEFANAPGLKSSLSDTLGWIYLKKKMYDHALQTFQSLVASNPADPTYRYHLGATLYQAGDKQKARTELEAALAAKPAPSDEPKIRELLAKL